MILLHSSCYFRKAVSQWMYASIQVTDVCSGRLSAWLMIAVAMSCYFMFRLQKYEVHRIGITQSIILFLSILQPTNSFIHMEAYDQQDKEKGLFTFYRQQAEEEDKIKQRRKEYLKKMKQLSLQSHTDNVALPEQLAPKSIPRVNDKSKKQQQQKKQLQKQQAKLQTDSHHKQFQKRLLEILEKHKYDRNKRRNLKVVMKFGENEDIALKYHLQALMHQQKQINRLENAGNKSEFFTHKKLANGAFQRVALCPTNFEVELDESIQIYNRNIFNKKIGNSSTAIAKRLNRVYEDAKQKQDRSMKASQILQRNLLLPKLNIKNNNLLNSNSVCINKQKYHSARDRIDRSVITSVLVNNPTKIKSTQDKTLCVESARYNKEGKISQNYDNRIYPIFIDSHQAKKCEEEAKVDKQKMFVEIIRKLKFK